MLLRDALSFQSSLPEVHVSCIPPAMLVCSFYLVLSLHLPLGRKYGLGDRTCWHGHRPRSVFFLFVLQPLQALPPWQAFHEQGPRQSLWILPEPVQGCEDLQTLHSRPQQLDPGALHILQGVFLLDLSLPLEYQQSLNPHSLLSFYTHLITSLPFCRHLSVYLQHCIWRSSN